VDRSGAGALHPGGEGGWQVLVDGDTSLWG